MKIDVDPNEIEKYRNTRAYAVGQASGYNIAAKLLIKTTHWKRTGAGYVCARCGAVISFAEFNKGNHRYCHECGAKVVAGA